MKPEAWSTDVLTIAKNYVAEGHFYPKKIVFKVSLQKNDYVNVCKAFIL